MLWELVRKANMSGCAGKNICERLTDTADRQTSLQASVQEPTPIVEPSKVFRSGIVNYGS